MIYMVYFRSMDKITFSRTYTVDKSAKHETTFAEYVRLTATLIDRTYMQTFKLVETWDDHKIIRRYNEAKLKNDRNEQQKYWWGMRKLDKTKETL